MPTKKSHAARKLCEYEGCEQITDGWVDAQWSPTQVLRWDMCARHLAVAADRLRNRTADWADVEAAVHFYRE